MIRVLTDVHARELYTRFRPEKGAGPVESRIPPRRALPITILFSGRPLAGSEMGLVLALPSIYY